MKNRHFNIKVFGTVQSVGFRHYVKAAADSLGVKGFVKNEPGGSLYIEAEGDKKDLDKFIDWSKQGPPTAQVEQVEVKEGEYNGFRDFSIRH